jgi:succinoglycan biosynthesis protein ExoA
MTVDIIIPARNAAALLRGCINAIARQSMPADRVIVVVGPSSDSTQGIADELASTWPWIRVLPNAAGDRGSAINEGLENSSSSWVAMVDAQSRLAPDYLEAGLAVGLATGADVVGGPMRPAAPGVLGGAIAAALRSRFGVGDSRFHDAVATGPVDSVYLGIYQRRTLDIVGRYDPTLLRTEDDDMNARIRAIGGVIWLDPSIRSTYLCRSDLPSLASQYRRYGFWKARFLRRRPTELRIRHATPSIFVIALGVASVASLTVVPAALPLLLAVYFVIALGVGLVQPGVSLLSRCAFPLATATMHIAYGFGFLHGLTTR